MKTSQYTFAEYSPAWPSEFEQESQRLRTLLGAELIDVHHIGSTSVPGLPAKPIIDVLPIVHDIERIDERTRRLEAAGYRAWGEYGLRGRRYFTKDHHTLRTHNLHFYEQGHSDIERHLAFCAYLGQHKEARDEYAALKRNVYATHPADIAAYNNGKDAWIKRTERLAIDWFRRRGVPPPMERDTAR